MKTVVTLVIAVLFIIAITQIENYLGHSTLSPTLSTDRDKVDYYLTDFSLMAVSQTGDVSYQVTGRHLAHWQTRKQSLITQPTLETADGFKLQTAQLAYDQEKGEISTDAEVFITHASGTMQSAGLTAKLGEGILRLNSDVRATYKTH